MKKICLLMLLLLSAAFGFAQTGLFNIAFDQTRSEVKATLEADDYGFVEDEYSDNVSVFVNAENIYIDHINVIYEPSSGTVVGWQVFYLEQDEESVLDVAYDACAEWHDSSQSYDEDLELDIWDLGNGRSLTLGYNYDFWVLAEYLEDGYEEYSEF